MQERITLRGEDYILTTPGETRSAISDLYEREQEEPKFRAVPLNPDELSAWRGQELANIPPWLPNFNFKDSWSASEVFHAFFGDVTRSMRDRVNTAFYDPVRALLAGSPTGRFMPRVMGGPMIVMPGVYRPPVDALSPDVLREIASRVPVIEPCPAITLNGSPLFEFRSKYPCDFSHELLSRTLITIDSIPDGLWHEHALTFKNGVRRTYRDGMQVSGPPSEPETQLVGHPKRNRAKSKAKKAARKRNRK